MVVVNRENLQPQFRCTIIGCTAHMLYLHPHIWFWWTQISSVIAPKSLQFAFIVPKCQLLLWVHPRNWFYTLTYLLWYIYCSKTPGFITPTYLVFPYCTLLLLLKYIWLITPTYLALYLSLSGFIYLLCQNVWFYYTHIILSCFIAPNVCLCCSKTSGNCSKKSTVLSCSHIWFYIILLLHLKFWSYCSKMSNGIGSNWHQPIMLAYIWV